MYLYSTLPIPKSQIYFTFLDRNTKPTWHTPLFLCKQPYIFNNSVIFVPNTTVLPINTHSFLFIPKSSENAEFRGFVHEAATFFRLHPLFKDGIHRRWIFFMVSHLWRSVPAVFPGLGKMFKIPLPFRQGDLTLIRCCYYYIIMYNAPKLQFIEQLHNGKLTIKN